MMVPPGSTIGIIGGGQLGRMLALAAARLGYRCMVLAPDAEPPAAQVAAGQIRAAYDDVDALERFAEAVDVATYEFENIPVAPLAVLGAQAAARASARSRSRQDRAVEKRFIERCGARVTPWRPINDARRPRRRRRELGLPLVLKTRRFGYDGKGQAWIRSAATGGRRLERDRADFPRSSKPRSITSPNFRSSSRAGPTAATPSGIRRRTSMATASCAIRRCRAATPSP